MPSSVSVRLPAFGCSYTFSGVVSVRHELSLKLQKEPDSAAGQDTLNGARNQPDKVVLEIVESDVGHPAGWAARMMQVLESVKRTRSLCDVVTSAFMYKGMLLSGIEAVEDETSQSGWRGTLTFTQASYTAPVARTNDNASAAAHTGSAGPVQAVTEEGLRQMLARAGIVVNF